MQPSLEYTVFGSFAMILFAAERPLSVKNGCCTHCAAFNACRVTKGACSPNCARGAGLVERFVGAELCTVRPRSAQTTSTGNQKIDNDPDRPHVGLLAVRPARFNFRCLEQAHYQWWLVSDTVFAVQVRGSSESINVSLRVSR